MVIVVDEQWIEGELAAGRLACPACGGVLRRWAWAAPRRVRQLDGSAPVLRPRRARCEQCLVTQVVLPAGCVPRRADAAAVIGAALVAKAAGKGFRVIAAELGRPVSTVRGWLRGARDGHAGYLRRRAVQVIAGGDPGVLNRLDPQGSPLADALAALGAAVAVIRDRLPRFARTPVWTLIGSITGGRLVPPIRSG